MPLFWPTFDSVRFSKAFSFNFGIAVRGRPAKSLKSLGRSRKLGIEALEARKLMASLPFGASSEDLGEFMLGRVAVTPVLLESNGAIDQNQLNWTAQQKADVLRNVFDGMQWWKDLLATKSSVMQLDWIIDTTYLDTPVETSYEPITRVSNDYVKWVPEFLDHVGFNSSTNIDDGIRAFNQAQREKNQSDWSFTIFVVNSTTDQLFAQGGSFSRAFAFAGGLYFVTPSNRPASTYTHETGHMFWARDEYQGGGNYYQTRGYYDSQNTNAIDLNPNANFQQVPSIMSAGTILQTAFDTLTTADATLAQIGWKDSDNDGIFDVLDVPLQLEGVGQFMPASNTYTFKGKAAAKALPNRNSSGLQNDITLNKVGRIEYRFNDSSPWQTALTVNQYSTDLDFSVPVPAGTTGSIQIRAIDPRFGITSAVFSGAVGGIDMTASSGVSGFLWSDTTNDGQRQITEPGLSGWNVQVVDTNGAAIDLQKRIEPDTMPNGVISATAFSGARITAIGLDADGTIGVSTSTSATTGTKVLIPYSPLTQTFRTGWRDDDQQLRINFDSPQPAVSADIIGLDSSGFGRLEVYSASGELLERITSVRLSAGRSTTLTISRNQTDIAYAIVKGHANTRIGIDNIRYGVVLSATTGISGEYRLLGLAPGSYILGVSPIDRYSWANPSTGTQTVFVQRDVVTSHVDFGFYREPSQWQNIILNEDTNRDGNVFALDVLLVINAINQYGIIDLRGSPVPTTYLVDVNGDSLLSPLDVLTVINYINASFSGFTGEGEAASNTFLPPSPADGEEPPLGYESYYLGDSDPFELNVSALPILENSAVKRPGLQNISNPVPLTDSRKRSLFGDNPLESLIVDSALQSLYQA